MKGRLARSRMLLSLIGCIGCSGGQEGNGTIALEIKNAHRPASIAVLPDFSSGAVSQEAALKNITGRSQDSQNPLIVSQFRVTVTGAGIAIPIVTKAAATADHIAVQDIPSGSDRTFLIEAINERGTVIRRRKIEKIAIEAGVTTPITTSLNTIPIILNLHDGSLVAQRSFHVSGFGEPGASLKVDATAANQDISLNESVGGNELVVSPSIATGLFDFQPQIQTRGQQTITVTDEATGESTSLSITVVAGEDQPGFRFISAGSVNPLASIGSSASGAQEGHFPLLVQMLAQPPKEAHQ